MKECKILKYLKALRELRAKNFKRNKLIQNGTESIDNKQNMCGHTCFVYYRYCHTF